MVPRRGAAFARAYTDTVVAAAVWQTAVTRSQREAQRGRLRREISLVIVPFPWKQIDFRVGYPLYAVPF
jgi:hypothetical protein